MGEDIDTVGASAPATLAECEQVIERGLETFVKVGQALLVIREGRLYKQSHSTFDAYCQERWGWSRQQADRTIGAAEIVEQLTPIGVTPQTESQARALAPIRHDPELMAEVMTEVTAAAEAAGTKVTAAAIADAVKNHTVEDDELVVEVGEEGIILPDLDLMPAPEAPPIVKPDLGGGVSHPARYSSVILGRFEVLIRQLWNVRADHVKVLDPFAGTGRIHELPFDTTGVELEPEWGTITDGNVVGDARHMPFADGTFDVVATSPTYGNRLADNHRAADPERRRSYTHDLGRRLTDGNTGELQWGPQYQEAHVAIWTEVRRVMASGGWLLLNIKDHVRNGEQQPVSHWHTAALIELGFTFWPGYSGGVATQHLRQGSNADQRAGQELVLVFRKG
jgi:hypothetical protein